MLFFFVFFNQDLYMGKFHKKKYYFLSKKLGSHLFSKDYNVHKMV